MAISSEPDLKRAYEAEEVASQYVRERFASEPHRLLHQRQVAAVQRIMDQQRPLVALEIAPGPGRITRDIRPAGELTCLEFNEAMIREGRAACAPSVRWVQGNAFELPFPEAKFDFVYTFRFIRHFQLADRQRLYAQIRHVLRPGGWLALDAVNERISRILRETAPTEYPVYDELYDPRELRAELAAAGFTEIQLESVQRHYFWQQRIHTLIGPRWPSLGRSLIRALDSVPCGEGLEWIVTCRRA